MVKRELCSVVSMVLLSVTTYLQAESGNTLSPNHESVSEMVRLALNGTVYNYGSDCLVTGLIETKEKENDQKLEELLKPYPLVDISKESPISQIKRYYWFWGQVPIINQPEVMLGAYKITNKKFSYLRSHLPLRELRRIILLNPKDLELVLELIKASGYQLSDLQEMALRLTAEKAEGKIVDTPGLLYSLKLIDFEGMDKEVIMEVMKLYVQISDKLFQTPDLTTDYELCGESCHEPFEKKVEKNHSVEIKLDYASVPCDDHMYEKQLIAFALLLHYGIVGGGYFITPSDAKVCSNIVKPGKWVMNQMR